METSSEEDSIRQNQNIEIICEESKSMPNDENNPNNVESETNDENVILLNPESRKPSCCRRYHKWWITLVVLLTFIAINGVVVYFVYFRNCIRIKSKFNFIHTGLTKPRPDCLTYFFIKLSRSFGHM